MVSAAANRYPANNQTIAKVLAWRIGERELAATTEPSVAFAIVCGSCRRADTPTCRKGARANRAPSNTLDGRGTAAQEPDHQDDHRQQQKNVDEPAAEVNGEKPKRPQNDQ